MLKAQARYCTLDNLKWYRPPVRAQNECVELLTWTRNVDNLASLVKACSISKSKQNPTGSSAYSVSITP